MLINRGFWKIMALTAGIVGLPNVGKSTLFNALTNSNVLAENYPFATIKPNTAVVEVKDHRIERLVSIFNPKRVVRATFEFTDIAGLVKGASKGEGLGNQFLANIRNTDAIIHVVRCFDDPNITHVEGSIDPIRDIGEINLELILADLQQVDSRIGKVAKKAEMARDKASINEYKLLKIVKEALDNEKFASTIMDQLSPEELKLFKTFNLLTAKPVIYVGNVAESAYADPLGDKYFSKVNEYAQSQGAQAIAICASTEAALVSEPAEERKEYLEAIGAKETGLEQITNAAYHILGLRTFFTGGPDEVRAWTFHDGYTAPQCAGIIHTDMEAGFIKAEVYSFDDLDKYGTEESLRAQGLMRTEGKEYVVKDGDCLFIKFSAPKKGK